MTDAATERSTGRRTAFRIVTVVLGVVLGLAGFALVSLVLPWFYSGEREIHRIHDLGWGGLGGLMLALPMILQGWSPERRVAAMQQILLVVVALGIASLLSLRFTPFFLIFVVVVGALTFLHPARGTLLGPGKGISWPMAVLVVAAAVPLVLYALDQAEISRACPPGDLDPHCAEFHWLTQAALGVGLILVGGLASLRTSGWRIPAWTAGGAAAVLGVASLVFPDYVSALPTGWAVTALIGGLAFVGVAEMEARRSSG